MNPPCIAVVIFYSKASGVQAPLAFSAEFRHCNAIIYNGDDWIMLDLDKNGLLTRRIECKNGAQLVRHLHIIPEVTAVLTLDVKARTIFKWRPWWTRSCNEIVRYTAGVDIPWTFNPRMLYKYLLKYDQVKNYSIMSAWRRADGIIRGRQRRSRVSKCRTASQD